LQRFDPVTGQFAVYRNSPSDPHSLSNNYMNCVYVDRDGTVWAGTANGLSRFNQSNGTFTSYYERDGLPSNWVAGILQDNRDDLWVSTNRGISRFNPHTRTFRSYFDADGLPGNKFQYSAAAKSSSGEMFFGSSEGLLGFFPERVRDDPPPPPVVLTDFLLFGDPSRGRGLLKQSTAFTHSLTLKPSQNVFSFEFSALSYSNPSENRYRYRLERLENEWNERDGTRRLATYTTLPPGDYTFRVQGRNSRGVWNENGVNVQIRILPPWWGTWQFRTAAAAIIVFSFWGFLRLRLRQQARVFNVRFEERLGERTRIARELHDTLLQSFHGLLLRFQAAHNLLPGRAVDARQVLETAIDEAAQAITEARDAVQDLRSSTIATNDLIGGIEVFGEELKAYQAAADGVSTDFSVQMEGAPQDLHPILRDEIFRITGEALRNAFHHSHARRIEVEIGYDTRQLRIRVRDDGIGIDASVLSQEGRPGHFGLRGMRERTKGFGGQLEVWSEHGAGTEVELTVPGKVAYGDRAGRRFRLLKRNSVGNS
jgi:signal transduction histidine kinase